MSNTNRRTLAAALAEMAQDKSLDAEQRLEAARQLAQLLGSPKTRSKADDTVSLLGIK